MRGRLPKYGRDDVTYSSAVRKRRKKKLDVVTCILALGGLEQMNEKGGCWRSWREVSVLRLQS